MQNSGSDLVRVSRAGDCGSATLRTRDACSSSMAAVLATECGCPLHALDGRVSDGRARGGCGHDRNQITPAAVLATPGTALISASVVGDADGARASLAPDVAFSALVPAKLIATSGREQTLAVLLDWFPKDAVWLERIDTGAVGSRMRVGYRARWESARDGLQVFEQQAYYYDVGDDGITSIRLVCSGDRPVTPG